MGNNVRIAYGHNRSDRDFAHLQITRNKIFIDNRGTEREELRAMLAAVREGVTVVVLKLSDFGIGAGARKVVNAIEAAGATVEGPADCKPEKVPETRGRKTKVKFTPESEKVAKALWLDPGISEQHALEVLKRDYGIETDRHHLNYRFIRKPKMDAAKRKKKK